MNKLEIFRRGTALVLTLALLLSGTIYVAAEPVPSLSIGVDNENPKANGGYMEPTVRVNSSSAGVAAGPQNLLGAVSLPSCYNSASYGYVAAAQNQGDHELCWAFTQAALAQINVKKDEGKAVDYSKLHMGYALSDDYGNREGYYRYVDSGGNREMSIAYLSRGSGFVAEAEDPYMQEDFPYRDPFVTNGYFSTGYLEAAPMLNDASVTQVKELIYEYGAAGCAIYYHDDYFNEATNFYYSYGNQFTNHAVTLVGWDDSKNAFIALNSWGTGWGDNGFFYISYNDQFVKSNIFATDYESDDLPFDGIRSYNNFGYVSYIYSGEGESLTYGTTYETGDAQTLEGVGTYVLDTNTKVEIYLNPYNGKGTAADQFKLVHTETFSTPGYYHISFENEPYLYGSQFNVKIKLTSAVGGIVRVPFQNNYDNYLYESVFHPNTAYFGEGPSQEMNLLEKLTDDAQSAGWCWSMQAFTNSDLSLTTEDGKVSAKGEEYTVLLKNSENAALLRVIRNKQSLAVYSDQGCTNPVDDNWVTSGNTYYLKLGNGTHIRRTIKVIKSGQTPWMPTYWVNNKAPDENNSFTFHLAGETFSPTVSTLFDENWALYALPNGVGRIGSSFTPTLYRSVIYLRVYGGDGILYAEYPIILYSSKFATTGYKDWSNISPWALDGVATAVEYGLLKGDENKNLSPKKSLTRAAAAMILVQAAGIECSKVGPAYAAVYADVGLDQWHASAISTASYMEMISGHSNPGYRCFSPTNQVNREQYASMMIRMLAYLDGVDSATYVNRYLDQANRWMQEQSFADLSTVSTWAKDTVTVALYMGLFSGKVKNQTRCIAPKDTVTREQAAQIIANSLELIQN